MAWFSQLTRCAHTHLAAPESHCSPTRTGLLIASCPETEKQSPCWGVHTMHLSLVPPATYDISRRAPLGSRMSLRAAAVEAFSDRRCKLPSLVCRGGTTRMNLLLWAFSCLFGPSFAGHAFSVLQFLSTVLPLLETPLVIIHSECPFCIASVMVLLCCWFRAGWSS